MQHKGLMLLWSVALTFVILCSLFSFAPVVGAEGGEILLQQQTTTSMADLQTLADTFRSLRNVKGHFEGGDEFIKDVDGFNGRKHQSMEALRGILGVKGTPAAQVLSAMGNPDEVVAKVDAQTAPSLMPGPVVPGTTANPAAESLFFVYYWRGRHDYLYFDVDKEEKVVNSAWYMAGE